MKNSIPFPNEKPVKDELEHISPESTWLNSGIKTLE